MCSRQYSPPHQRSRVLRLLPTGSGQIGFDELYEFIKGRRHSLDPRGNPDFDMRLRLPDDVRVADVAWDVDVLRTLIVDMLRRGRASPAHMLERWGGRRGLHKEDWSSRVRSSFFEHEGEAWEDEVRGASQKQLSVLPLLPLLSAPCLSFYPLPSAHSQCHSPLPTPHSSRLTDRLC